MRTITTLTSTAALAGLLLSLGLVPASAADPVDVAVSSVVVGGNLTAVTSAPAAMASVTLDGQTAKTVSAPAASAWNVVDARGTGATWSLSAAATDFTSAAGTVDTTARTILAPNLSVAPGTITAAAGSDAAPTATALTMSTSAQTLVTVASGGKGSFEFTPQFTLTVPANSYRSNYTTTIGGATNPYVSTITFTIG